MTSYLTPSRNFVIFQVQIAEGKWPSRLYWLDLAKEFSVTYKNKSIASQFGSAKIDSNQTDLIFVKNHVEENFLQVSLVDCSLLVCTQMFSSVKS